MSTCFDFVARAHQAARRQYLSENGSRIVTSHLTTTERRGCVRKRGTMEGRGPAHLSELMRLLDNFGLQRSRVQIQLHSGMVGSVLQRIFCNDSDADMRLAMQTHRIKSSRQQFMAITPRRFGKTTAVAMFVAAFALACPGKCKQLTLAAGEGHDLGHSWGRIAHHFEQRGDAVVGRWRWNGFENIEFPWKSPHVSYHP